MQAPASRARIADVAREAGVSTAAVSFAFNSPGRLAAATVSRIHAVADRLGYRPDPVARMLARRQATAASRDEPPAWVGDAVFYQVFPDRFARSPRLASPGRPYEPWDSPPTRDGFKGGDLLGIAEHLDHVASLGATALYLNPIFRSASNHRYHTYDYLAVDPLLGGDAALRELLDAAHARGMRVILDGVFNHTGRGHWAFHHVLETGRSSPYRSWFHFDEAALDAGTPVDAYPDAHRRSGQARGTDAHDAGSLERLGYQAWWDLPALPKLNTDEPAVRAHLFEVAEHWLKFGADGWRLDVPAEIDDPSFWTEFRDRCRAVNPEAYLVGEIWDLAPEWLTGDRFDGLMNYPLAKATLGFVGGASLDMSLLQAHDQYAQIRPLGGAEYASRLEELAGAYRRTVTEAQLNLLGSHDTPRLASIVGGDRDAIRLALLLQATLPGAPCLYYGDEVGLSGGIDPDCRRAFPWEAARWDRDVLGFVRAVFEIRHREPLLRRGELELLAAGDGWLAFERRPAAGRGASLIVAVNAGSEPAAIDLGGPVRSAPGPEVLGLPGLVAPSVELGEGGRLLLDLPGRSGAILRVVAEG